MQCCCCGATEFNQQNVLWQGLIAEWNLSPYEAAYINRQQGSHCVKCGSNLRSIALAKAIMRCYGYNGLFQEFVQHPLFEQLTILEINEAGNLTSFLQHLPRHQLKCYPEINMENLPFENSSFDLVIHSDTLEHVENSVRGLVECYRILKVGGFCAFTVPIITNRLTTSRRNLSASYHGQEKENSLSYRVWTEYGSDIWEQVITAGFQECRIISLEYPTSQAIIGVK